MDELERNTYFARIYEGYAEHDDWGNLEQSLKSSIHFASSTSAEECSHCAQYMYEKRNRPIDTLITNFEHRQRSTKVIVRTRIKVLQQVSLSDTNKKYDASVRQIAIEKEAHLNECTCMVEVRLLANSDRLNVRFLQVQLLVNDEDIRKMRKVPFTTEDRMKGKKKTEKKIVVK